MPSGPHVQGLMGRKDVGWLRDVLADRHDVILALTDESGRLLWASRTGTAALLGFDPQDMVCTDAVHRIHPRDRGNIGAIIRQASSGMNAVNIAYRLRTADDRWLRVRGVAWPLYSPRSDSAMIHIIVPRSPAPSPV